MTKISKEQLAKKLLESKKMDDRQFQDLVSEAREQKKSIFQLIMEREIVPEEQVVEFLCEKQKLATIHMSKLRLTKDVLKLIPKRIIEKYMICPISRIGNLITIAAADPFNLMMIDDLKELTKCHVCLVLATPKAINAAIDNYFGDASNLEDILGGIDDDELELIDDKESEVTDAASDFSKRDASDAPVVRMVNVFLDEALRSRASDIHFEPYESNFRVRYRIDGALKEAYAHSRELYGPLVARMKIMSLLDITEKRLPQDGRFRISVRGRDIDFRVSILPTYHGEKVVLRVLDRGGVKSGLNNLGFSENATAIFDEAVKRPYGMILVTGPTGSGKSTTLYTILSSLNTMDRNIMTVEDPVEYQIEGITQTQVHPEVGLTFASGLRCLLRQSPDVILVGEIRDGETADIGVKAALTGHLVFSTLHTNSAAGAVTRLIDMGVEPFLIASSVICVAAQRLLRKICPFCKTKYDIPPDALRRCNIPQSEFKNIEVFKGKGCAKCNGTGYFGRLGAIELLSVCPEIRELVIQRASSDKIQEIAVKKGMETLFHNAFGLFKKGLTTLEEVLRVTTQE